MDKYAKELVALTAQQQEIQRQIDATGLIKLKQGVDDAIANLKEKMKDDVEAGVLPTGKQDATLPSGDILTIEPRSGKTEVSVEDYDLLEAPYRMDEMVDNAGVLPDGTMYILLDTDSGYYNDGNKVYKKGANLGLIKNCVKLGQKIAGVFIKKSRPSIVMKLNGKTLK